MSLREREREREKMPVYASFVSVVYKKMPLERLQVAFEISIIECSEHFEFSY